MPDFAHERRLGLARIAGVDEAGRGPIAGPVVAAAVILDPECLPDGHGIDDSKRLSAAARLEAVKTVRTAAIAIGFGVVEVEDIDRLNIRVASLTAMRRALDDLPIGPEAALIDGRDVPEVPGLAAHALIGGDGLSLSIAAASILAKVTRDRIMEGLSHLHPEYGWAANRGYPTRGHLEALARHGVSPHHRKSFAPVHKMLWTARAGDSS